MDGTITYALYFVLGIEMYLESYNGRGAVPRLSLPAKASPCALGWRDSVLSICTTPHLIATHHTPAWRNGSASLSYTAPCVFEAEVVGSIPIVGMMLLDIDTSFLMRFMG